jgi:hypothetical protein
MFSVIFCTKYYGSLVGMYIQSDFSNALHLQPRSAHQPVHIRKRCYNIMPCIDVMSTTWMVSNELHPLLADQISIVCKAIVCFQHE